MIAQAPEDEVTAEILALQSELLHQVNFGAAICCSCRQASPLCSGQPAGKLAVQCGCSSVSLTCCCRLSPSFARPAHRASPAITCLGLTSAQAYTRKLHRA